MRLSLFTAIAKGEEFVSKIRIYHLTFGPKEYSLTVDASSNAKTAQAKEILIGNVSQSFEVSCNQNTEQGHIVTGMSGNARVQE